MINNHQILKVLKTALVIRLVLLLLSGNALLLQTAHAQVFVPEQQVIVAVIDEGVDFSHPVLKNKAWQNLKEIPENGLDDDRNGYIDDINGWNFLDKNKNLSIQGSHGTKLAGIIAGEKNSKNGFEGVSSDAVIMSLIVCRQNYGCEQSGIIQAIYYAVDNGARVINLSLGDTSGYKKDYDQAILYAYERNVVIVASSGNSPVGYSLAEEPMSPICNDNGKNMVLGVGTVDEKGVRPSWANFGGCIDISAKGTKVFAPVPRQHSASLYEEVDGNSYATAYASGVVAALVKKEPKLLASQVISRLHTNATGKNFTVSLSRTLSDQYAIERAVKPQVKVIPGTTKPKILAQNKAIKLVIR
ncbi:MAG: S8 family serine peptidase [Candidatus Doudnabacteria bacterium]|nr:S8 family serine peptidase [Candidatus Doudnabacteria bacterium]